MKKVLFVCINYNNEQETFEYIENIQKVENSNLFEVVIVNNSEKENLEEKLKSIKNINYHIYNPNKNLGYLNGMFYGLKEYMSRYELPQWIVFSNTDIEIEKFNLCNKDYAEDIWCIAPSIYSVETKSFQNPHYTERISKKKLKRLIFINGHSVIAYVYSKLADFKAKLKKNKEKESQYIYAAHGAFFILRKPYFEKIRLNYGAFLYSEEAFIAETIRKLNKKVFYDKNIRLIHKEHSTTKLLNMKKKSKYIKESLKYILGEFYNND